MKKVLVVASFLTVFIATINAQTSYGSDVSATLALPTGPNSEFYKVGYGAIGGFYYEMESNWRFGLTLGFIRFGVNSTEVNNYFQTLGQEGTIDIDGSVSTIPILISAKYLFPGASVRFYGMIEGGLYTYWTKTNGTITYTGTTPGTAPVDQSEFSSEIGFDVGFGALFPISKEVSLDANVRYHFVKNSGTIKLIYDGYDNYEETVSSSQFLTISIGANWNFNL